MPRGSDGEQSPRKQPAAHRPHPGDARHADLLAALAMSIGGIAGSGVGRLLDELRVPVTMCVSPSGAVVLHPEPS